MANALLVSYSGYPYTPSSLCPDNGLAGLAAVLQGAGHGVRILDFGTVSTMRRLYPAELSRRAAPLLGELAGGGPPRPELLQELAALDADLAQHQARETAAIGEEVARQAREIEAAFVGFKLWNGDGFSGSVALAESLRERLPGVKLFAGGPHATWCGPLIYRATDVFDAICLGEAEQTILALARHATHGDSLAGVPGIVRGADDQASPPCSVVLDDLPPAAYDEATYPAMAGDEKLKLIVIDESRGCPHACAFCTHPYESGRRLRTRSAARIVDEMARIVAQHGIRAFRFAGSSTPGSLMAGVAEELLRRGLQLRYSSFGHVSTAAPEHFARMRQSGLHALFFGIETGSEELRRRAAGKKTGMGQIREAVLEAKAAGVRVACSMIVPMPFETEETFAESLQLMLELRPDSVLVQFPGLLPNTPWLLQAADYGFEVDPQQYVLENMNYKIKLLFPPAFWKPLPYKLGGMEFAQFTALTARFTALMEQNGILTGVTDDHMLMADLAGMGYREFRDAARVWCAAGGAEAMQAFVTRHNRAATATMNGER